LVLGLGFSALVACLALRFVPRINDALAGTPEYVRVLTESVAEQMDAQSHQQFPVIVEQKENGPCSEVKEPTVPEKDSQGILYVLTYSESQHLTCVTAYSVPTETGKFSTMYTIAPEQGRNYGPTLLHPVRAAPVQSFIRVYSLEYLKRLHWRYKPHFPLSPSEAASLASRSYYSGDKKPGESAGIEFNYEEIRAEVAKAHNLGNLIVSFLLIGCAAVLLSAILALVSVYRRSARYCRLYHWELTVAAFLKKDFAGRVAVARRQFFERQKETQDRLREKEKLRLLRERWEASLHSSLPNLNDEQMRMRVQEALESGSLDLEGMKALWLEIQEKAGQKTPGERLSLLLESVRPYCTEEEFQACRAEVFAMLSNSGFRPARKLAISMHDQFKARAREMEGLEKDGALTGPIK